MTTARYRWIALCALSVFGLWIRTYAADLEGLKQRVAENVEILRDSDDDQARHWAKVRLLEPSLLYFVGLHRDDLIQHLNDYHFSMRSAKILSRLPLNPELREELKAGSWIPDEVKARLGNEQAEERLILRSEQADSVVKIRKSFGDLLFAATPTCLESFLNALESEEILSDVHGNQVSKAHLLLQLYGEYHPEVALLSEETLESHGEVGPEAFANPDNGHQAYLKQVAAFFKKTYDVDLRIQPPLLYTIDVIEKFK